MPLTIINLSSPAANGNYPFSNSVLVTENPIIVKPYMILFDGFVIGGGVWYNVWNDYD